MQVGIHTNRLTRSVERAKMKFPAAPRNRFASRCAPGSLVFLFSALLRLMKAYRFPLIRAIVPVVAVCLATSAAFAITKPPVKHHKKVSRTASAHSVTPAVKPLLAANVKPARRKVWVQTWDEPTYKDSTASDQIDGEDLNVRKAAVDALG